MFARSWKTYYYDHFGLQLIVTNVMFTQKLCMDGTLVYRELICARIVEHRIVLNIIMITWLDFGVYLSAK